MVDRRALDVEVAVLGVGPDEPVEVAGLELVGVAGQGLEVGDAVVAGPGREDVAEGERAQRGEAAGAAAADGQAVAVDPPGRPRGGAAAATQSSTSTMPHCAVQRVAVAPGRSRCCRGS